ncbi:MAG: hypothetical protein QM784_18005 [Polyangiaceae bacterium]
MLTRRKTPATPWQALAVLSLILGCRHDGGDTPSLATSPSIAPTALAAVPLDHLAPGELRASSEMAFGFPIPTAMKLVRAFPDEAHLTGDVEVQGLVRYVQEQSESASPELHGNTLVFARVRMKRGAPERTYRFEITRSGRTTSLRVKDTTPTSTAEPEKSTDEERWRKAGYKPNGEPLDVGQLK